MCLIDRVLECDEQSITCTTNSHRDPDNPLLENGRLSCIVLIEYASQAAAIHAAFNRQEFTQGKPAYIGSVKNIKLYKENIENLPELALQSVCLLANATGAVYEFIISERRHTKSTKELRTKYKIAEGQLNLVLPR